MPLEFIGRLLDDSSAARRVAGSGNPAALERHAEAREAYRQARAAQAAGDRDQARRLGAEAARIMSDAVRLAETPADLEERERAAFERRLETVNALMEAHQRLIREEALGPEHRQRSQAVRQQVDAANALFAQGDIDEARAQLDGAYAMARVHIEEVRDGDTVVHSLVFASKEEEYRFELRRYDTHRRLVELFMQERASEQGLVRMVEGFVQRGEELRSQAERQAARSEFGAAVDTLGGATAELVRALRSTGLFIPG